jgi:anti-sigma factor RsiW
VHCARAREKLTEYQFGLLEVAEAAEVERHLASCEQCRSELAALRRLDELIRPVEQVEAPANLWSDVHARMRPRRAPFWQRWRGSPKPALAMAAAMLLAVGGIWLGLQRQPAATGWGTLESSYQEQQIVSQWSQPLADDAAMGALYASLNGMGEDI